MRLARDSSLDTMSGPSFGAYTFISFPREEYHVSTTPTSPASERFSR